MERVGRNIFRGGGAEIFKTCVCSGLGGGGLCKLMIWSQRGGRGHLKCSEKKESLFKWGLNRI